MVHTFFHLEDDGVTQRPKRQFVKSVGPNRTIHTVNIYIYLLLVNI